MLRFNLLASVVPMAVAAVFARGEFSTGSRPCIEVAGTAIQIATLSWQANRHVSFTSDPRLATVRVQISDSAEAADFTVIDDIDNAEAGGCAAGTTPQLVGISTRPQASEPVIYLSKESPRRLPDLRPVEELLDPRRRRPDRRRPRRPPPGRSRVALIP